MADSHGRWSWDVPGFEPPAAAGAPPTAMPRAPPTAMVLRPTAGAPRVATGGVVPVSDRLEQLADSVQVLFSLWALDLVFDGACRASVSSWICWGELSYDALAFNAFDVLALMPYFASVGRENRDIRRFMNEIRAYWCCDLEFHLLLSYDHSPFCSICLGVTEG
jgi:hypothetical protein